jgi:multiple sugar transport system permease protein
MEFPRDASGQDVTLATPHDATLHVRASWAERLASSAFVWPAVLIVLALSIFPLIMSLYLSFSRIQLVRGGFDINFVGILNYRKLLIGSQQDHFLGVMRGPTIIGWLVFALVVGLLLFSLVRSLRKGIAPLGLIGRIVSAIGFGALAWLLVTTIGPEARPGTLVVTLIYVFGGITVQYTLGLGLALLCLLQIPGQRFFRVVFLLPMMITPVGVAYMFRMMTDTSKGPLKPIWQGLGLGDFSWVNDPWGARAAVMIGDIWQWTPFMFIVLLAALQSLPVEASEAAVVDGANRWHLFRYIVFPQILPVSTTLILIRMIEAFKIVDLPNVLTGGGPGTATESLSLHAYITWRSPDAGGSAAIAYLLLIVVTFLAVSFVNVIRRRATEAI